MLTVNPKSSMAKVALGTSCTDAEIISACEAEAFQSVELSNWSDAPEGVLCQWKIVAGEDAFFLHYYVEEPVVRATMMGDQDFVCEDSCVEWFVTPPGDNAYFNFEFNPIGAYHVAYGPDRHVRQRLSINDMPGFKILTTEGVDPLPMTQSIKPWELWVRIPFSIFDGDSDVIQKGTWKMNVYKCGDKLPDPHHLSWGAIDAPAPDFHRPEYFVSMQLFP
jgi:hypothetical protein